MMSLLAAVLVGLLHQGRAEQCSVTLPLLGEVTIPNPGEARELTIGDITVTIDKEGNIQAPQLPAVNNLNLNIYDLGCEKIHDAVGTITVNSTNIITNINAFANNPALLNLTSLISSFGDFKNLDISKIKELVELIRNSGVDLSQLPEGTMSQLKGGMEAFLRESDEVTRAASCEAFLTLQEDQPSLLNTSWTLVRDLCQPGTITATPGTKSSSGLSTPANLLALMGVAMVMAA